MASRLRFGTLPMRTERHVTFTFALTFTSSFPSLSVSQPNASTSVYRDVNVNAKVSASANVGVNVLRKQALGSGPRFFFGLDRGPMI